MILTLQILLISYTYVSIYFDSIYSDSVLQKVGLGRTSDRVNASHSAVRLQLAVFGWSPDNNTSTLESLQDGEHITWPMIIKFPLKLDAVRSIRKPNIWNPFIACTVTHIFIEEILSSKVMQKALYLARVLTSFVHLAAWLYLIMILKKKNPVVMLSRRVICSKCTKRKFCCFALLSARTRYTQGDLILKIFKFFELPANQAQKKGCDQAFCKIKCT